SAFEWYAHAAVGRHIGLTAAELDAVRDRRFDALPTEHERVVAETTHALATLGDLDDAQYQRAVTAFGPKGLFELLTLVGYYGTLALQLRVFRIGPPEA